MVFWYHEPWMPLILVRVDTNAIRWRNVTDFCWPSPEHGRFGQQIQTIGVGESDTQ